MTRKRPVNRRNRIVTAFAKIPAPLPPGKVRCLGCSAVVSLTKNGHIRAHRSPAGEPCAYRATYVKPITLTDVPPIAVPERRKPPGRKPKPDLPRPAPVVTDSRGNAVPYRGECVDCGKWLPGERTVCGRCANRRNDTTRGV